MHTPKDGETMNYLDFISQTLNRAAEIARSNFGKVTGVTKTGDSNQVLTETDLAIGQLIVTAVQEKFPEHNIIDEEAGVIDRGADYTWVIDPIDGTSNFAAGLPTYGIMLGLIQGNKPIAGGIALPAFNEIFLAQRGGGASCNGRPLKLNDQDKLIKTLVAYQIDGHQENPEMTRNECRILANLVLNIRNLRSNNSVFDTAAFLKGAYGGCLNQTSKIWDNVAPHIIVEEAGGVYTDFFGNPITYDNPTALAEMNFTNCIATKKLFAELQRVVS